MGIKEVFWAENFPFCEKYYEKKKINYKFPLFGKKKKKRFFFLPKFIATNYNMKGA